MYDFPEVRDALGAIWRGVAKRLKKAGVEGVPTVLQHDRPVHELWSDPTLLLSQCCGYDIVNRYAGKLVPLATPRYTAPGCEGSDYASVVLVGESSPVTELEQLRGSVCVVNGPESHSGTNTMRALIAPLNRSGRFFSEVLISGSHAGSLWMLTSGRAEVTAIDCVTYALLERYRPEAVARTRQLCFTERVPSPPYVTRLGIGEKQTDRLRRALLEAFDEEEVRAASKHLFLDGIEVLPLSAYQRVTELERFAAAHGYAELR